MSDWFRRKTKNIQTINRKDIKEGSWIKCNECSIMIYKNVLKDNFYVCHECNYHFRIPSNIYIDILIDNKFQAIGDNIISSNPLKFNVPKDYSEQIKLARDKTGKDDAITIVKGPINNIEVILGIMDFSFIGGSMGSVVGEKISLAIESATEYNIPLIIITASGGARMQEGVISLMQLAKTSTKLAKFSKLGGLFIPVLTDPTTGGISASIAMQGDVIVAEPNALIGFAGPRVIKQTIGQDLPEGFQKSEFLLEKGFLDHIIHRKELKNKLTLLMKLLVQKNNLNE
ncbi:MAG: acetyl-CoA carboxylase carboxyl transferase subunit beta [Candidatus Marinimicrobia bacterium]|nr:acetyl-CoA carboxylase carboxyl transferase subunit beta [Candidatus Neomarinimicrobiota bacterium]|tara:strand:- start:2741 stop:3598 length:858 start_codon:yes stop_codon:yes gene_type:complete